MNDIFTNSGKAGRTQKAVYEAALDVFSEFGFRKTCMEDIARRLGLAVGTLYRYADDKQDLYRKSVSYAFERWQSTAEAAALASNDPLERFRLLCTAAFRHLKDEPRLRRILAGDPALFPVAEGADPFEAINRRSVDILEHFIREGAEGGAFSVTDPRLAALVIFSLYQLLIEKAYVEEKAGEAALFEQGLELILNGLKSRSIPLDRGERDKK